MVEEHANTSGEEGAVGTGLHGIGTGTETANNTIKLKVKISTF